METSEWNARKGDEGLRNEAAAWLALPGNKGHIPPDHCNMRQGVFGITLATMVLGACMLIGHNFCGVGVGRIRFGVLTSNGLQQFGPTMEGTVVFVFPARDGDCTL